MKAALVIMAAGMGSRYGGSKQVDGIGPGGEGLGGGVKEGGSRAAARHHAAVGSAGGAGGTGGTGADDTGKSQLHPQNGMSDDLAAGLSLK